LIARDWKSSSHLAGARQQALHYAGYIPQETMFWRRRVWDKVGAMDVIFNMR